MPKKETKKAPRAPSLARVVQSLQEKVEHLEAQVFREQEMVAIYESQIVTLRDKLQAVCLLVGDLANKPDGCLRDRVARLETVTGDADERREPA